MAASPSFDPNHVEDDFDSISRITANCTPAAPLVNRASAGLYVPGLDVQGDHGVGSARVEEVHAGVDVLRPRLLHRLRKAASTTSTRARPFGTITLFDALTYSVNSVFCNIGLKLGARTILDTAKRFGFYERPPLETPADERLASGLYRNGKLFYPKVDANVDAGRMAFGQERMLVTALQIAMVAGAIGFGGRLMEPHVVDRIVAPGGKVVEEQHPRSSVRPSARRPRTRSPTMMRSVVARGTGTAAQIYGYSVGGKTGTGETGVPGSNTTWFIAFAGKDEESPAQLAIAVVLQNQSGTGGTTAAPIARSVMQAILQGTENP